jgi:hypothetical protein
VRFGPDGAAVEKAIPVGEQSSEMEGPHGLAISPDGRFLLYDDRPRRSRMLEIEDVASGRSLARLPTSTKLAHGVAVSPDSRYAFATSEGVGGYLPVDS